MTHTPAPWIDDSSRKHHPERVLRHRGVVVARIPTPITKLETSEFDGNVQLMQHAAEMFDLLRELYENQGAAAWSGNDDDRARFVSLMDRLGVVPPKGPTV